MHAGAVAASVTTGMGEEVRNAPQDERLRANTYGLLGALLAAPPAEPLIQLLAKITPAEVGGGDDDLASACRFLRDRGFQLVAAHLSEASEDYRDIDYTRPTALVVGTELFGVSEEALALSDRQVMIPMKGMTQSLNVSVACAIVLYEAMRQREAAGLYGRERLERGILEAQRFEWMHPVVAAFCRERGLDYPELDENGDIIGEFPRA